MTDENGTLVSSSTSESESLIIQANTRCIFEGYGPNGEIRVRFETGDQKFWSFFQKGINYVTDSTLLQIGKRVEDQR